MYRKLLVCAAIVVLPSVTTAQRGGAGGSGRGMGGRGGRGENSPVINDRFDAKAFSKLNPATILIDKRKDLKLDDTQRGSLDEIAKRFDWNTKEFLKLADSLSTVVRLNGAKGRGGADSTDKDPRSYALRAMNDALSSVRQEYDLATSKSLDLLSDEQRAKARPILKDSDKEIEDRLEKAGFRPPKKD